MPDNWDHQLSQSKRAEAVRRILQAEQQDQEWLDLGDLALAELPPELGRLTQLRYLSLGNCRFACLERDQVTGTFDRERDRPTFIDLTPLRGLTTLTSLDLSWCEVKDLAPLRGLTALTTLDLSRCPVTDLMPLSELTALTSLDLSWCEVKDLAPLRGLTALTTLDLSRCPVTDLMPLSELTALTTLKFSGCRVTDLMPLSGLTALTTLKFSECRVTDLTPLRGLAALTSLDLSACRVTDLMPLSGLTALTTLKFSECRVTDLTPLRGLAALTTLKFSSCPVTDLMPLSELTALTTLDLSWCEVKDLAPLRGLTALTTLKFSSCPVTDLMPLSELTALTSLDLSGCQAVTDLMPLSGLTALTTLKFSRCPVTELMPLSGLTALGDVDIYFDKHIMDSKTMLLIKDLYNIDDSVREHAADQLGLPARWSEMSMGPLLKVLAADRSDDARAAAAWSIGQIAKRSNKPSGIVAEKLRAALNDANDEVRTNANIALRLIDAPTGVAGGVLDTGPSLRPVKQEISLFVGALSNPDRTVRTGAAAALRRIGGEEVVTELIAAVIGRHKKTTSGTDGSELEGTKMPYDSVDG